MMAADEQPGLVEFLRARLAEDEQVAWAATPKVADPRMEPGVWEHVGDTRVEGYLLTIFPGGGHDEADAEHIARHDPARVLADVEAKRRIIELCVTETSETGGRPLALRTLRLLALPYASHPAFKEEWKP